MTGQSLVTRMAERRHLDANQFYETIKNTVMPKSATKDQLAAFLMVADRYGLDPITREIYAFPGRGGGITPVLSIDGWIRLVNEHPQSDGFEFSYAQDSEGKLASVTCRMYRKDREHPTVVTELLRENWRDTEPWRMMPSRMLRHKAFKEAARYCFGFAGVTDEDEARDQLVSMNRTDPAETVIEDLDAFAEGRIGAVDDFASGHSPTGPSGVDAGENAPRDSATPSSPTETGEDPAEPRPVPSKTGAEAQPDTLRKEAIAKVLALANDSALPLQDRLEELDNNKGFWDQRLTGDEDFVRQLFATATKVARGEQKLPTARRFMEGWQ